MNVAIYKTHTSICDEENVRIEFPLCAKLSAYIDIIDAEEDVTGHLRVHGHRLIMLLNLHIGIDFKHNILDRVYLGLSDVLVSEHLIAQVVRLYFIHIPDCDLGKAESAEILTYSPTYCANTDDVDITVDLCRIEKLC